MGRDASTGARVDAASWLSPSALLGVPAGAVPAVFDVDLEHVSVKANVGAVVHLVVAAEAARVEVAAVVARDELETPTGGALGWGVLRAWR